jgi:2-keto-4-pentenoate hydratase/2-oxohepta-3-ene-1,7-dioic acid hydratase in catechol pathway
MKIIRYQDSDHRVGYAALQEDGTAMQISGDILGDFSVTKKPATVAKLLAPLAPSNLLCVGLNYRQHAAESNATIPEFPVLFMKLASAVQNPGDPIVLPRHLRSNEVDYEAELAIVIGRT